MAFSAALEEHLRSARCVLPPVVLEASRLFGGIAALVATAVLAAAAVHIAQMQLVLEERTVETAAPVADQKQERQEQVKARPQEISAVQVGNCAAVVAAAVVVLLELQAVLAAVVKAAMEQRQERQEQLTTAAAVVAAVITAQTVITAAKAALES